MSLHIETVEDAAAFLAAKVGLAEKRAAVEKQALPASLAAIGNSLSNQWSQLPQNVKNTLIGAGIGTGTGLTASALQDDEGDRQWTRNAIIGALMGGSAGALANPVMNTISELRQPQAGPVDKAKETIQGILNQVADSGRRFDPANLPAGLQQAYNDAVAILQQHDISPGAAGLATDVESRLPSLAQGAAVGAPVGIAAGQLGRAFRANHVSPQDMIDFAQQTPKDSLQRMLGGDAATAAALPGAQKTPWLQALEKRMLGKKPSMFSVETRPGAANAALKELEMSPGQRSSLTNAIRAQRKSKPPSVTQGAGRFARDGVLGALAGAGWNWLNDN